MDTARILTVQLWRLGLPVVLGIAPILDPVQPAFQWCHVTTVHAWFYLRYPWGASPSGSSPSGSEDAYLFDPCLRLSTRSFFGYHTPTTEREGIAPSCQT